MENHLALLVLLIAVPTIQPMIIRALAKIDTNDLNGVTAGKTLVCSFHMETGDKSKSALLIRKVYQPAKLEGAPYNSQDQEEIYDFLLNNPQALPEMLLLRDPELTPAHTNWGKGIGTITFSAGALSENKADGYLERKVRDYALA